MKENQKKVLERIMRLRRELRKQVESKKQPNQEMLKELQRLEEETDFVEEISLE